MPAFNFFGKRVTSILLHDLLRDHVHAHIEEFYRCAWHKIASLTVCDNACDFNHTFTWLEVVNLIGGTSPITVAIGRDIPRIGFGLDQEPKIIPSRIDRKPHIFRITSNSRVAQLCFKNIKSTKPKKSIRGEVQGAIVSDIRK